MIEPLARLSLLSNIADALTKPFTLMTEICLSQGQLNLPDASCGCSSHAKIIICHCVFWSSKAAHILHIEACAIAEEQQSVKRRLSRKPPKHDAQATHDLRYSCD